MLLGRALVQPSTAPTDQPNGPRFPCNEADEAVVSSIDRPFALDPAGTARGARALIADNARDAKYNIGGKNENLHCLNHPPGFLSRGPCG